VTWHSQIFRKTHNRAELGELCVRLDPTLEPLLRRAAALPDYAWKCRSPGEPDEPPRGEAEQALALAREVYTHVLTRLPEAVRPAS
jgi:hypothetical protein